MNDDGKARAYVKRNPTATVAGATGTIVGVIIALFGRAHVTLQPEEVAGIVLFVGWLPVAFRWWLDRKAAP